MPEITFLFWVIKHLTTCGGEAVSDYLALGNRQVGAVIEAGLVVIALVLSRVGDHVFFIILIPAVAWWRFGLSSVVIVTIAVAILVGYLAVTRRDVQPARIGPAGPGADQERAHGHRAPRL